MDNQESTKKTKKNDERRKKQEEALDKLSKEDIKKLILDIYHDAILEKYNSNDLNEVIKKINTKKK